VSVKTFATNAQARREVTNKASADFSPTVDQTVTDDYIWEQLREVGGRMVNLFEDWDFEPKLETRNYDAYGPHIYRWNNYLVLEAPLLEATGVIDADGTTLTQWDGQRSTRSNANQFEPVAVNTDRTPYIFLRRLDRTWAYSTDGVGQIQVTGYWGFGRNGMYFKDSGDKVEDNPLAASSRTITVGNSGGEDYFFTTPRFSRGNLLRLVSVNGTEFVKVLKETGTTSLGVERGVNGTTAVEHPLNTPIEVWYPEPAIVRAVARWTAYLVSKRMRFASVSGDGLGGNTVFPKDIPLEIQNILREYDVETKLKLPGVV
jgi:hypothetical protein